MGAGDPRGCGNQQRRAHDTQPDRAHKAWILRGAPHTHHAFRRGRLHHPDRHLQRWVLCINSRDMAYFEEKCRETRAGGRRRRDALSLILRLHRWMNYNYSLWCHPSANSEIVSRVCASVSWHMFIKFSLVSPSPRLWFPSFIVSCMRKDSL